MSAPSNANARPGANARPSANARPCANARPSANAQPSANSSSESNRGIRYVLPPIVESLRSGWQASCTSAAVVSSLLASVSASLLSIINDDYDSVEGAPAGHRTMLYIASFGAILFNASATMTSIIIIDQLADLPRAASTLDNPIELGFVEGYDTVTLLNRFGLPMSWKWTVIHWLCSLLLGMWCLFLQIIIYVWTSTKVSTAARVALTVVSIFAVVPVMQLGPLKSWRQFVLQKASHSSSGHPTS